MTEPAVSPHFQICQVCLQKIVLFAGSWRHVRDVENGRHQAIPPVHIKGTISPDKLG